MYILNYSFKDQVESNCLRLNTCFIVSLPSSKEIIIISFNERLL